MMRPRWRIGAELLPVLLVLACLAGSLALVLAAYRRSAHDRKAEREAVAARHLPEPPAPVAVQLPPPPPPPPPTPAPAEEDPTPKLVAELNAQTAAEVEATGRADRKAKELERARLAAENEATRWRRREMLVRAEADRLDAKAAELETEVETLGLEIDVLARERDTAKDKLEKLRQRARSSFAVLPYKGPNGTWQRPIAMECHDGMVTLQPNGPSFGVSDLVGFPNLRGSPFVAAVAQLLVRAQRNDTPDGAPSVPYILFIVRPDGIRPYYEARARLEPLGIAFGYELVEQDEQVDYPDLDDLAEWDNGTPGSPARPQPPGRWPATQPGQGEEGGGSLAGWPTSPSRSGQFGGGGGTNSGGGMGSILGNGNSLGLGSSREGGTGAGNNAPYVVSDAPSSLPPPPLPDRPGPRSITPGGSGSGDQAGARLWRSSPSPGTSRWGDKPEGLYGSTTAPAPISERDRQRALIALAQSARAPGTPGMGTPNGANAGGGLANPEDLPPGTLPAIAGATPLGSNGAESGSGGGLPRGTNTPGREKGNTSPGAAANSSESAGAQGGTVGGSGRLSATANTNSGSPLGSAAGNPGAGQPPLEGTGRVIDLSPGQAPNVDPASQPFLSGTNLPRAEIDNPPPLTGALGNPPANPNSPGGSGDPSQKGTQSASGTRVPPSGEDSYRGGGSTKGGADNGIPVPLSGLVDSGSQSGQSAQNGQNAQGTPSAMGNPGGQASFGQQDQRKDRPEFDLPPPRESRELDHKPERVLDLVVICSSAGVTLKPGGFRISQPSLKAGDGYLMKQLRSIVAQRQKNEPQVFWMPRINFLVEPGGESTYREVRRQTILSNPGWPVSLKIDEADKLQISQETR